MFTFTDVTQLIVGSAAARRSETKRLDRMYKDAEANLKLFKEVTRSSPQTSSTRAIPITISRPHAIPVTTRPHAIPITTSRPLVIQDTGVPVAKTPALHRTISTPAVASFPPNRLEEFKRTNSESQIANPQFEMTGFGAYRRAANASASWQLNHLEEKFKNDGDIIAKFLGDQPPMGIDTKIWREYRKKNAHKHKSRQASVHTFSSSRSPSSSTAASSVPVIDACSEHTDPATGTKVIRGFHISQSITISKTSSPASSRTESLSTIPERKKKEALNALSKAQMRERMRKAAFESAISSDDSEVDNISEDEEENWEDI
ncbi:hypothetical protein H2200_006203 [Cladophialophora chaetospira]|uniref:Uncharacterized protein n=1 Tax=Cladophialophora chaetospira TaxID=386627 RepID=A0AA38XAH4_9EURO|nr:hypothetical protein H2200_006203 [Cladophialophora chaetospira]